MQHFIAALEPLGDGSFSVFFPDLPGCVSAGDTAEEAIAGAMEALSLHLEGLSEDGETPRPRSHAELLADPEMAADLEGCVIATIPHLTIGERQMRVNISASKSEIDAIDAAAQRRGVTRSAFLLESARQRILSEAG